MKRFLSIIFIFILSIVGLTACTKTDELTEAKDDAIDQIEAYISEKNEIDYLEAEWAIIESIFAEAKVAIEGCTSADEIQLKIAEIMQSIDAVEKTNSIEIVKAAAEAELNNFKSTLKQEDYKEEDWLTITNKINQAITIVKASSSHETIANTVATVKSEIGLIVKIDLVKLAKDEALSNLNIEKATYNADDYYDETWAKIQGLFSEAEKAINAATTVADVENIYDECLNELFGCMTKSEEDAVKAAAYALEMAEKLAAEFAKYNAADYAEEDYKTIKNLYESTEYNLYKAATVAEIDELYNAAIAGMSAVHKLIYITYHNIEDSTWVYSSILEIREVLLADYNEFRNEEFTYETLPLDPWSNGVDFHEFFFWQNAAGEKMNEKWTWLVEVFAAIGGTSNKGPCGQLLQHTSADAFDNANTSVNKYALSYEFRGFIKGSQYTNNKNFLSADYSLDSVQARVFKQLEGATSYQHGTTYNIPSPARKYQEFLGWYTNPDFNGEAVTVITEATENINLYAKWSELTGEGALSLKKEAAIAELEDYIETSKDQSKYSAEAWATVEETLAAEIVKINACEDIDAVDTALAAGKAALDAILPTNYTVTYELNGGHWKYASKEELVAAFLADFSEFKGSAVTAAGFFDNSFGSAYAFFTTTEWKFFAEYLKELNPDKATALTLTTSEEGYAQLRIEIVGYITSSVAANKEATYTSSDYSAYAEDLGWAKYLQQTSFEYVETIQVSALDKLIKEDYKFIGWYDNANFTGEAVTEITGATTLYAKFELLTSEDKLNAEKEKAKAELDEYVLAEKDFEKFNETDRAAFDAKVVELKALIDAATSFEAIATELVNAKEVVAEFAYSTYFVEFELDGGHWYYENKAALIKGFIADFNTMRSSTTAENFFNSTWTTDGVISRFFNEFKEWQWLVEYVASLCTTDNKSRISLAETDIQLPYVRTELHGWFNSTKFVHDTTAAYTSDDYTGTENDLGWAKYLQQTQLEFLDAVTEMPVIYKAGYTFAGWYDNAELTGEAVTTITGACKLYAKWEVAA